MSAGTEMKCLGSNFGPASSLNIGAKIFTSWASTIVSSESNLGGAGLEGIPATWNLETQAWNSNKCVTKKREGNFQVLQPASAVVSNDGNVVEAGVEDIPGA